MRRIALALVALAAPLLGQDDSVRVTTFVRCPQVPQLVLDSLNSYQAAAAARDSALRAFFVANRPACPAVTLPVEAPRSWEDHVVRWAPVALGALAVGLILWHHHNVKETVLERTVVEYRDPPDDRRAVP